MVVMARGSCGSNKIQLFTAHFSALFAGLKHFFTSSATIQLCFIQCITNLTEVVSNLKLIPNGKKLLFNCRCVDEEALFNFIQANEGDLKCLKSVNSNITFFCRVTDTFFREKVDFNGIPINSFDFPINLIRFRC